MKYQLRFGGEGGQGVITAGEILAEAAIKEGRQAFKASTYTSQVRGGPTKVDIIIDDTPGAIIVSCFNLYRRAIATKVIELLVEDGRIQPARIEEIHEKVCKEFDNAILEEGETILMDLGLSKVHPEITKLIGKLKYRASYGQNALAHSLEVAHLAGIIAAECGGDENLARRAGILHDIGKALTHDFEGSHVDLGAELCKRYKEHPVVINAIYAHHGHEEATSIESAAVCAADTLSAARPGARREVLEAFLRRVSELEEIAKSKEGIKNAMWDTLLSFMKNELNEEKLGQIVKNEILFLL